MRPSTNNDSTLTVTTQAATDVAVAKPKRVKHSADSLQRPRDLASTDSLAADSLMADSLAADSIVAPAKEETVVSVVPVRPDWWQGIRPHERHFDASRDPSIMGIIVVMFLIIAFSFRHFKHMFPTLFKELVSVRSRSEVFDEHTAGYGRLIMIMVTQTIVFSGMALATSLGEIFPGVIAETRMFTVTLWMILLTACVYTFQLVSYKMVGYSFTGEESARQWIRGFNASIALSGFPLAIVTVVMILYPLATKITLILAAVMFIIAKILFIYKGFRIFYHKFPSLLYFILYLCALEITPLLIVFQIALKIVGA